MMTKVKLPGADEYVPGLEGSDVDGWMSPLELYWLREIASRMDSVVEVGSWKGRSTLALLAGCDCVWAVDTFLGSPENPDTEGKYDEIKAEFLKNVGNRATLVEKPSLEAVNEFVSVDMVFIDGAHDYNSVYNDVKAWTEKAKLLICGHDYNEPEVKQAVIDLFGERVQQGYGSLWYVELGEGIGYLP